MWPAITPTSPRTDTGRVAALGAVYVSAAVLLVLMVRAELERYLREHPGEHASYDDVRDPSRRFSASAATLPARPVLDRITKFYDVTRGARGHC